MIESVFANTGYTCVNAPSKESDTFGLGSDCSKTIQEDFESGDGSGM